MAYRQPSTPLDVEKHSRERPEAYYAESLDLTLETLGATRPDIYWGQLTSLGVTPPYDVEPCDLPESDKLIIAAGALEYFLGGDTRSKALGGIPSHEYNHDYRSAHCASQQIQDNLFPTSGMHTKARNEDIQTFHGTNAHAATQKPEDYPFAQGPYIDPSKPRASTSRPKRHVLRTDFAHKAPPRD